MNQDLQCSFSENINDHYVDLKRMENYTHKDLWRKEEAWLGLLAAEGAAGVAAVVVVVDGKDGGDVVAVVVVQP